MRRNEIILLREFIVTQSNFWTLFPGIFGLLALSSGVERLFSAKTLLVISLSLLPFFLYIVRERLKLFAFLVAAHAAVPAILAVMPMSDEKTRGVCVGLSVGFSLYSLFLRLRGGLREDPCMPPAFAVVFAGVCFFILQYYGQGRWKNLIYVTLILTIALHFLRVYIEGYLSFLALNEDSAAHIPEKEMFRSGIRLTAGYTLAGAVILITTADVTWFRGVLRFFSLILRGIVAFLFQFLPLEDEYVEQNIPAPPGGANMDLPIGKGTPFWLWDVLGYTAVALVVLALLAALWKMMRMLVLNLRANWKKDVYRMSADGVLENLDTRERLDFARQRPRRTGRLSGFLSVEMQIRRLYRRQAVSSKLGAERLSRMTARECADSLEMPEIALIYEKARYGNQTCGKADLKEMKTYVR